jgi:hypothetical protein
MLRSQSASIPSPPLCIAATAMTSSTNTTTATTKFRFPTLRLPAAEDTGARLNRP